ncbi:MAG: RHS repeat-associated core domain-containing protein [Candidatus Thiodiazotropha sp. L084R]
MASTSLFYAVGDSEDNNEPVITFVSPTENSTITAPVEVIGSVTDDNLAEWLLFYRRADADSDDYTVLATGTGNISEQVLATFDPSSLTNGIYQIVLQATDINGNSGVTGVNVLVEGDLKLGNFSFTVEDLNLPMAGIPIRVTRTYDSRKRAERLGFGQGWTIDYQSVTVDETGEPSQGWERVQQRALFILDGNSAVFNASCLYPTTTKRVAITLPNGDVETFTVRANNISGGAQSVQDPSCYLFAGQYFNLEFVPQANTTSILTSVDANNLLFNNTSGNLGEITTSDAAEVTRYTLTTRTGYIYSLNQDFGIENVTDPNGNTLTYSDSGIAHSSGKSIEFIRDTLGRITHVVDSASNVINYQYDANGDLVGVIKHDGAEVNYTYYGSNCSNISATTDCHLLDDIRDPLGRRLLKNIYDANGRLIAQEDQNGNRTDFNHDIDARQSVITDRNGNITAYYYDDNGNITTQVDALGHTKTFTYDINGNQLSQTDELGNTTQATYNTTNDQLTQTDALGNTLTYTYNNRGQETRITDARGNEYVNTYDALGNLSSLQDPEGNIVVSTTDTRGLVTSIVDSVGNTTSYTYDSDGNRLTETDQLGNATVFTYDDRNNVLTETRTRTVNGLPVDEVTGYVYDDRGRLIQTTDALGNITRIEYNLAGSEAARIDGLGHRTELEYDAYGNLLEIRYPDGTAEIHTYDAENNKLSTTDRSGHVTRFEYDTLNRLTRSIHSDGATTSVEYDAAGRVSAEIDTRGNRTMYEYDAVNRRTASIDALGNLHEFYYDEDGNLTSETDANGNTTAYTYNTLDQRANTTYADGTTTGESFDALARVTQKVDQAGRQTDYTYDYSGRLTQVTDALGGTTGYSYDEQGNKLTQTDAENKTTSWRYDSLGRVLSRTLPLGQQETFAYDNNGNLTSHTDFNGDTTTHQYDGDNRLSQSDYADGTIEVISYDANGNRSQVDVTRPDSSQKSTLYSYDLNSRLETEVQPDGTVLTYQYDAAGNRTQVHISLPDGSSRTTDYSFDNLNRLESVTDAAGITSYGYDAVGNRTSVSYPNGSSEVYQYNNLNRLTRKETYDGTGALVQAYDYTLHVTGRRTQIDEQSGRSTSYSYDDLYRLTSETITDSQNGDYSASYQYDGVGNRTYNTIDGVQTAYTYDDNDRLTQQGGTRYTYDENGNTLTETIDTNITTYGYNAKNELVSVEQGGNTTEYGYNPNGIRSSKSESGVTTSYVVDENRDYAQVLIEDDGTTQVSYTYGDDLISQDRGGETSYYHYDGLGSTRSLTDSQGNLANTYDYEAFGEVLGQTGTVENGYLFAGEQFDSSLDQYYLRARYYDQSSGRFTQQDSWMGNNYDPVTLHKYLYANADPGNMVDPSGNFSLPSLGTAMNVLGTLTTVASASYELYQFASGEREFTAGEVGAAILWAYAGSKANLLTRGFYKFLRKSGCLSNSFAANTLVSTKAGFKRIDEIEIGDVVLSFNEATGKNEYQSVLAVISSDKRTEIVTIELESGSFIEATPEHLIFADGRWVQARELLEGMVLKGADGESARISKVDRAVRSETVYDLTVEKNHNFYITEEQILVHNISPCEKAAQALAKAVPKTCTGKYVCDDFAVEFERLLLKKGVKGKRLCVKSTRAPFVGSLRHGNISKNDQHFAVQIGEMVFDSVNPNGVPYAEWANDIGVKDGIGIRVSSQGMTGAYNGCIPGK